VSDVSPGNNLKLMETVPACSRSSSKRSSSKPVPSPAAGGEQVKCTPSLLPVT
jgi:hypothetical protein